MPAFSWNEAETRQLTTLFHEGLSFRQIASVIGSNKTKSACISKSKRIGLPHRGQIIACERSSRESVKRSPRPRIREANPVPAVDSRDWRCDIIGLKDRSCRYPLWELAEDEHLYCGRPTARLSEGRPYCSHHAKLSFHTK